MSTEAIAFGGSVTAETSEGTRFASEVELSNCVPSRLSVRTANGRLLVPPLGRVRLHPSAVDIDELRPAEAAGVLTVTITTPPPNGLATAWATLASAVLATAALFCAVAESTGESAVYIAAAAALIVVAGGWCVSQVPRLASVKMAVQELPARLREAFMFALAAAIVFALPGAILYFGSDVPGLIAALHASHSHDAAVALIGIGVQFLCIVGASALPVLLYFIFDRERILTLRQRVTRNIFRVDPGVTNLGEIETKYGQWLDEAFGRRNSEARFLPGTRWPILIATAVITLGWAVALLDTKPATMVGQGTLTALITPTPAAPTFAFLGAYFFTLNSVLRGFVRGDLRPKTYAQVATRIVSSVVLAFTIERLMAGVGGDPSSATLLTFAFLAGVVPETVLIRMQEAARGFAGTRASRRQLDDASRTFETEPLTRLQGIDIYDRARLLDEGVTNVEGLAHHDVVELLLKTRIPATRLLDWVDQAILFIHCAPSSEETEREHSSVGSTLSQLRRHGIRTATELSRAYDEAPKKEEFVKIVKRPRGKPPIIPVILAAIKEEDWMRALEHWRDQPAEPPTINVPEAYA
jgi:hypothetical protein